MKTFKIVIDGLKTNEYMRGRISGMIYVLTGQAHRGYAWRKAPGDNHWIMQVLATDEQIVTISECIEKVYPDVIMLVTTKE